jgi:hypothetical protein
MIILFLLFLTYQSAYSFQKNLLLNSEGIIIINNQVNLTLESLQYDNKIIYLSNQKYYNSVCDDYNCGVVSKNGLFSVYYDYFENYITLFINTTSINNNKITLVTNSKYPNINRFNFDKTFLDDTNIKHPVKTYKKYTKIYTEFNTQNLMTNIFLWNFSFN